jgi:serine/threonine-protein kinase
MAIPQTLIGQTLAGKYRVIERLGQGQNAVVYKAQQLNLDRYVALKVIERGNRAGYERLQQESQVLAQFHHPGIRQVYSIETDGPYIFAVLDYIEQSLKQRIEERRQRQQAFIRSETVQLLRPIGQVLDYLHSRSWAHMDVKPENILVADDGRVVLADFGVAQLFGPPRTLGTATYVAPEVINAQPVGATTDLYSLAVIAFEMLAGAPPFSGDAAVVLYRQHTESLPPRLDRLNRQNSNSVAYVVNRALAKNPQQRYGSAMAFLNTLSSADTLSVRLPTLPRRRPVRTAIATASVVCVSALVVGLGPLRPPPAPISAPKVITIMPTATPGAPTVELPSSSPSASPGITTVIAPPKIPPANTPEATVTRAPQPSSTTAPERTPTTPPTATTPAPACNNPDAVPGATIVYPPANAQLQAGQIPIRGTANLPNSAGYEFQYRLAGDKPDGFHVIDGSAQTGKRDNSELGVWDTSKFKLPTGAYVLKLRVKLADGNYKDCDVPIILK